MDTNDNSAKIVTQHDSITLSQLTSLVYEQQKVIEMLSNNATNKSLNNNNHHNEEGNTDFSINSSGKNLSLDKILYDVQIKQEKCKANQSRSLPIILQSLDDPVFTHWFTSFCKWLQTDSIRRVSQGTLK